MNKDVIYIEPEDDITDVILKIENSKEKIVALVPPKKADCEGWIIFGEDSCFGDSRPFHRKVGCRNQTAGCKKSTICASRSKT